MKEKINTMLERLELESMNGLGVSETDINQIKTLVSFAGRKGELTDVEINDINSKISNLNNVIDNIITLKGSKEANTAKSLVIAKTIKDKLTNSELLRKRIAGRVAVIAASAISIGSLVGCSLRTIDDEGQVYAQVQEANVDIKEETSEKTGMDDEYQQLSEKVLAFAQDEINKGLPANAQITEENKDAMSKSLVGYYMLNQMDSLTDEKWANIFQNSTTNASDLMNAKFSWEWIDEQRVTVSQDNLDYSLLFEEADARLLNTAAEKLNAIKANEADAKQNAINDFKAYIMENLGSENMRMQYSERALDTFRAIYFDAFDTLTNGNNIDDELEHAVNTTITCSIGESALDVEDPTIQSLQSKFETYEMDKLNTRFENGWNYVSQNREQINEYNDISYIVKYVSENIDLTKQYVLPSYEDTLASMFLVNDKKSVNDSGVIDDNGNIISLAQFQEFNIDPSSPTAKQQLEQAVQVQEQSKVDATESVTDAVGNVIVPSDGNAKTDESANYAKDYSDGYYAGNNGLSFASNRGPGYKAGYEQGKKDLQDLRNSLNHQSTTTFEPVNGEEITNENITTDDYTEQVNTSTISNPVDNNVNANKTPVVNNEPAQQQIVQPTQEIPTPQTVGTSFVSISDGAEEIIEESEITEYTYNASNEIEKLEALKEALISNIDEQLESSKVR